MGIARRLARDSPQAETLGSVEARALDTPVVQRHALGLAVFEVELAVIHAVERVAHQALDPLRVHAGAVEEQRVQPREIGHLSSLLKRRAPTLSRDAAVPPGYGQPSP